MLLETIKKRSLEARKAKDTVAANLLGMVLADIQNRAKEAKADPTENDAIAAVKSAQKKNTQAIDLKSTPQLEVEKKILDGLLPPVNVADINIPELLQKLAAENDDKFQAAKENPKLQGWFRGQVMKATGGKAAQADVDAALEALFA